MNVLKVISQTYKENRLYIIVFVVILAIILIKQPIIYHLTKFEKTITIKEKYIRYRRKSSNYNVVDTDGNIYKMGNLWFKFDFNRADDYAMIDEGKTYKVKGYGYRFGFFDAYQTIYSYEQV